MAEPPPGPTAATPRPAPPPAATARVALVSGGSRGIGLATATALARRGHRVLVGSRSGRAAAGLTGLTCDVTDSQQVEDAFAQAERDHGPVQIVVSNVGARDDGLLMRMAEHSFRRTIDTNLTGAWRLLRRAAAGMADTGWGRVVLVSSVAAVLGTPGQANYAAAKAGLAGLARSAARELGPSGITVNVVLPGFVDTDLTRDLPPRRRESILSGVPLGRSGTAREIAETVAFLTDEQAGYVTGAVLPVDGGLAMGH
ncbi:3-oxoacyl-ACP reductase FabG [Streptomyces platensis]|uniref:3-oxoacyl-ACP reductase FabG n=1 Tax=Streptomyces platensis TaxID=58346 RepID=UPI0036C5D675